MKKIISTCIALMVSAACSISAFAMEVPTNTTIQDLNGVRQYIKIYTVAPDTDPQSLIDDVFEYDGYTYTYSSMTKEEQSYSEKEHHTETVTADTEKSDLSVVLKALSPSIEYDDGEFRGTLYLDHSTISTVKLRKALRLLAILSGAGSKNIHLSAYYAGVTDCHRIEADKERRNCSCAAYGARTVSAFAGIKEEVLPVCSSAFETLMCCVCSAGAKTSGPKI